MNKTDIVYSTRVSHAIDEAIQQCGASSIFMLYPESAADKIKEPLHDSHTLATATHIPLPDGEEHKSIATLTHIWEQLLEHGATRHSLIVNVGGGLTTDMGGFAAACYMRGIRYINIPTTLLACIDASYGGKTGVNLAGVKNIVGAFHAPIYTIISPEFLRTLPPEQILSGWAEMIKHALLQGEEQAYRLLSTDPSSMSQDRWLALIRESIQVKIDITTTDPYEQGVRKLLNLGHTVGHAIEALSQNSHSGLQPISHGHAVAVGLVSALALSVMLCQMDSAVLYRVAATIKELYPAIPLRCEHYPELLQMMHHDKKNTEAGGNIHFALLRSPGHGIPVHAVSEEEVKNALDITRDLLGL